MDVFNIVVVDYMLQTHLRIPQTEQKILPTSFKNFFCYQIKK